MNGDQVALIGDGDYGGYVLPGYSGIYTIPTPSKQKPSYISCSTQNQDPDQGITEAYCVCSGSTFPKSIATDPPNSCAYTTLPASATSIYTGKTTTVDQQPPKTSTTSTPTQNPLPPRYTGECLVGIYANEPNGVCGYTDDNGDDQNAPCGPGDTDFPANCENSGDPCYFTEGSDAAECHG